MTKVLVTGGTGFIGSRLVRRLLRDGYSVRVLDVNAGRLASDRDDRLELVGVGTDRLKGGVMDPDAVSKAIDGVDVVYHLALNWDGPSWRHALPLADRMDANVRGTLNVLEAAALHRVRHFLYAGSVAVCERTPPFEKFTIPTARGHSARQATSARLKKLGAPRGPGEATRTP